MITLESSCLRSSFRFSVSPLSSQQCRSKGNHKDINATGSGLVQYQQSLEWVLQDESQQLCSVTRRIASESSYLVDSAQMIG